MPLVSLYDKVILDDKCIFTTSPELNSLIFHLELSINRGPRILNADDTNTWVTVGNNLWIYSLDNGDTWSSQADFTADQDVPYCLTHNTSGFWIVIEGSSSTAPINVYTTSNILTGWTSNILTPSLTAGTSYTGLIYSSYYERYVAVSQFVHTDNAVLVGMYSTDGLNWLSAAFTGGSSPGAGYNELIEGTYMPNHRIVAVGGGGATKFGYSDDGGLTWKRATWPTTGTNTLQSTHSWNHIAYGYDGGVTLPLSGRFVAGNGLTTATSYNQLAYSDDGINWTGVKVPLSGIAAVAYGKGMFIALTTVASTSINALTSTNGINWGLYTLPLSAPAGWADAFYANDRFIIESNWNGTQDAVIMSADWPGWINTNY